MLDLKSQLIKLGSTNPELRPHIREILKGSVKMDGGNTYETEDTHISQISWGDLVEHNGVVKTVGKADIKRGGFHGDSLFGDSYMSGRQPVKKVVKMNGRPVRY